MLRCDEPRRIRISGCFKCFFQEALVEASVAAAIERGPQECVRQLAAGPITRKVMMFKNQQSNSHMHSESNSRTSQFPWILRKFLGVSFGGKYSWYSPTCRKKGRPPRSRAVRSRMPRQRAAWRAWMNWKWLNSPGESSCFRTIQDDYMRLGGQIWIHQLDLPGISKLYIS